MTESNEQPRSRHDGGTVLPEASGSPITQMPRSGLIDALRLWALWSFAVAQPVYVLLSKRLKYLTDTGVEPNTVVLFTFIVSLVIPALLIGIAWLTAIVKPSIRNAMHIVTVAVFAIGVCMPALGKVSQLSGLIVVPLGIVVGVAFAWAYYRWQTCRTLVTATSPGIVVFPVWFLFLSPVYTLLSPEPPPAAGTASAGKPTTVVMVVFDEASGLSLMDENREIDKTLFPNFSDLSQQSTWFRNATTVHPFTANAVPAILTAEYPRVIKLPTVEQQPVNLFTLLLATNQYEFVVFEPYTRLFPEDRGVDVLEKTSLGEQLTVLCRDLPPAYLSYIIPSDFPADLPTPALVWFGIRGRDIPPNKTNGLFRYDSDLNRAEQFEHFLRCIKPREKPTLYFHHIILPHCPWNYLPSGKKFKVELATNASGPAGGQGQVGLDWGPDELIVAQNQQRYYLQFRFVDRLLGRLIEQLKESGIYDSTLLIVTADHGVSFVADNGRRFASDETLGDILSIPMFIKAPGQQSGGPDDRNVESVDLLPTILGTMDYQPLPSTDGQNVLAQNMKPRPEKLFFQSSDPRVIAADFPEAAAALSRSLRTRVPSLDTPLGPASELVGREVTTITVGADSDLTSGWVSATDEVLEDPLALVPCLFQGKVSPTPKPDQPVMLAIAVNGTIAGTARTYQLDDSRDHWSVLFPEKSLRVGKNSFELYELRGEIGSRTLHRVTTSRMQRSFMQ